MRRMREVFGLLAVFITALVVMAACTPEERALVASLAPQAPEVATTAPDAAQSPTEPSQGTVEALSGPTEVLIAPADRLDISNDIDPIVEYQFVVDAIRYRHPNPDVDRWYWQWRQAGWTDQGDESWERVSRIIECESGGNERADKRYPANHPIGLFQIDAPSWVGNDALSGDTYIVSVEALKDPAQNMRSALAIKRGWGWRQWECR